ncbi:type I-G CRISPR-associated helicase/endonuclease Cas3g [Actinokineospora sp.]|uniref:type I-G CRISPR-associated helicase/endonuclease Cas3g n=1 Tax=Actinokineospora sp. TaxID=1872133 RepID=UPI004037A3BA
MVTSSAMDFTDFAMRATADPFTGVGVCPYPYQVLLAERGLPDVLRAPTGTGKTLAAVLPWLFRRNTHPGDTPHRLAVVLPQRSLVEQTVSAIRRWLGNLGVEVPLHVLMGGEDLGDRSWQTGPDRDAIFVGTQDMVLSRLLMRGYAEGRAGWPMSFGLLHAGTQWVFDEVQLMGPGLPTSLQLQGLRESLGAALPCRSMWMSATVDTNRLSTVDFTRNLEVLDIADTEVTEALRVRLDAARTVRELDLDGVDTRRYPRVLAERVIREHRPGTRTLVVLNTVERAMDVHAALAKESGGAELVLLHSRFRADDRRGHTARALAEPGPLGTIVVATQVLEAGVDVTSDTLVTEVAPWPSVVQRAGRCNRDGLAVGARLFWVAPPAGPRSHLPYAAADLAASAAALTGLAGRALTGAELGAVDVAVSMPVHPVLRRRDLLDLFDTAPDLSGNDIDVSPFVRDPAEHTTTVAWRDVASLEDAAAVGRGELCPAPIAGVRELIASGAKIFDQVDGRWRAARREDVRPSATIVLDAARGGYLPERGFDPNSAVPVEPCAAAVGVPDAVDTDPHSAGRAWVSLAAHLDDTARAAADLLDGFGDRLDLSAAQRDAIVLAARYHDIGKAHGTFATSLEKANVENPPPPGGPWAKSPSRVPLRHSPPHFRHELVSALLLLDESTGLLDGIAEPDLVTYLALAHHGKVRLTVRGRSGEPFGTTLGVREGESTLPFEFSDGTTVAARPLSLLATRHGENSLTAKALRLRDRTDLGPFRVAFAEALVRAADWRASAEGGVG